MAYTKITNADLKGKGVVGLPDTPNLSTSEMQQKFDEIATDVIVPKFNNLVDELDASNIDGRIESDVITNMTLNVDNNIEVSTDGGKTYKQTASSGHIIMDGTGRSFPQRSRMQYSANVIITDNQADGTTFVQVPSGVKGEKGDSATIKVGNVQSSPTPYVNNVGSQYDAIFDFGIPQGADGQSASIQVGTVTSGSNASVSNRGTSTNAILDFVLPKGEKGDSGTSFQVLGTYPTLADLLQAHPTGNRGDAYAVGNSTFNEVYNWNNDTRTWDNLGALKGAQGDPGQAATVTVGTVTTGQTSSVVNSGTTENAIFDFTLEKGDKGDKGDSATIAVGNVTGGAVATVTNVGTPTNAVFDFIIPKGDKGDSGEPTIVNGKTGDSIVLYGYDMYLKNYVKAGQYSDITDDDSVQSAIAKLESRNSGGSKIVVETDSDSIGNTFTVSNGVKTLTQVADATMKMEFFVDDIGTWTITNVEAQNSTTVEITYFSAYHVTLGVGDVSIVIEYSADYVGYDFSITNGTKTLTKTAQSDLVVSFIVADHDTWTVSNTLNDQTKTVKATEGGTYKVKFEVAPVPSLDITAWLSAAGISKTFSSLDDVLADEPTVRTLFTKHDAVDYLVANGEEAELTTILNNDLVAKWINLRDYALDTLYANCKDIMDRVDKYFYGEWVEKDGTWQPKGNVPIMTANNAPYGECIGNGSDFYKVFDNNDSTYWSLSGGTRTGYVGYKFANPVCVREVYWKDNGSKRTNTFTIDGSNDNSTWETIYSGTATNQEETVSFDNDKYFLYYRFNHVSASDNINMVSLQFYGRELSVSVPKMDSNTTPWGEVIESGHVGNQYSWYCFDGTVNSATNSWADDGNGLYIGYDFGSDVNIKAMSVSCKASANGNELSTFKVQYSNDKTNWNDATDTQTFITSTPSTDITKVFSVTNGIGARYWRISDLKAYTVTTTVRVSELQFFGLDYSEHEERHYIYDHGVEVEEITSSGLKAEGSATLTPLTKESNQLSWTCDTSHTVVGACKFDISDYKLLRFLVGNKSSGHSWIRTSTDTPWTNNYISSVDIMNVKEGYIDITNANGEEFVSVGTSGQNAIGSLTEWWLE